MSISQGTSFLQNPFKTLHFTEEEGGSSECRSTIGWTLASGRGKVKHSKKIQGREEKPFKIVQKKREKKNTNITRRDGIHMSIVCEVV